MVWNNSTVGSNELDGVAKAYVSVVNDIATFINPTPPTNIITNETILTKYSIKQALKVFEKRLRLQYTKNNISWMISGLLNLRNPKISVMISGKGVWHI